MIPRTAPSSRGRALRLASCLLLSAVSAAPLCAAGGDSAPQLVSRTGGAGWSTPEAARKAADAGDPEACARYGELLLRGDGVPPDPGAALDYLRRAAEKGHANASFRLGKIHDDGELVARDTARAIRYYTVAANAGVSEAQYNLGAMYVSARGVKRDYVEGLAWLIIAAKNGAPGDGEQQVRSRLTESKRPQLIAKAEKRAAEIEAALAAGEATPATPGRPQAPKPERIDPTAAIPKPKVEIAAPAPAFKMNPVLIPAPSSPKTETPAPATENKAAK